MIRKTWIKGKHAPDVKYNGDVNQWVNGDITVTWNPDGQRYKIERRPTHEFRGWVDFAYGFRDVEKYLK
jgi:hypothetical protein